MQNAIFIILVLLFFFSSRCSIELESWTHLGFYKRCGRFVLHINTEGCVVAKFKPLLVLHCVLTIRTPF